RLGATILDFHVGEIGNASCRLLVRCPAITVAPVPDCPAAPMVSLILIFSVASVFNVHVDWRWCSRVIFGGRGPRCVIESLLLEAPADYLSIGAASLSLAGPVTEICVHQCRGEAGGITWISCRSQCADRTQNKIYRISCREPSHREASRTASNRKIKPEQ